MKRKYPSAEFLYAVALDDYSKALSNYEKIYDRVNIILGFCGVLLLAVINNIDVSLFLQMDELQKCEKMIVLLYGIPAVASVGLIIISIFQLLLLSRSRTIMAFDSKAIEETRLYNEETEDAALWIISKYIQVIDVLKITTREKQEKLNRSISLFIVSLALYVLSILIYNGVFI